MKQEEHFVCDKKLIKKDYKKISYKLFLVLIIIMLTSGIIFGFDKGDFFLFIVGSSLCYIVYKKGVKVRDK